MTLKQPASIEECVYFTNRLLGKGKIKAWVFKSLCDKCNKGMTSKPKNEKTGKASIRAKEYICPECGNKVDEDSYERTLTINIQYMCPHCLHEGELTAPFKRKKVQVFYEEEQKKKTVDAVTFQCEKCKKSINITKKMK